jgi:hypothetical protein
MSQVGLRYETQHVDWRSTQPRAPRIDDAAGYFCQLFRAMKAKHIITKFPELEKFFENADFTDVKVFEGDRTLRNFIASMLSFYPWWMVLLYRMRKLLVTVLGLVRHEAPEELPLLQPGDVSFTPGEFVTFFAVRCAQEDVYWISETPEDRHLRAYFGVVKESVNPSGNRFFVITTVYYKHWTGLVYFNLIRPFHHLVVYRMARSGLVQ